MITLTGRTSAHTSNSQINSEPVVETLPDGLRVRWDFPVIENQGDHVAMSGFARNEMPGQLMLPIRSLGVAVPPNSQPDLQVSALGKTELIRLDQPVGVAPIPAGVVRNEHGDVVGGDYAPADRPAEKSHEWVTFEEAGTMAGVRLGRLVFNPVSPNFGTEDPSDYLVLDQIEVELKFNSSLNRTSQSIPSPMHDEIANLVINRSQIKANLDQRTGQATVKINAPTVFIETDGSAGMVKVDYADLKAAGFPVDTHNANNFHLYRGETEISWHLAGDGTNPDQIENGESLIFYAAGNHSRWMTGQVFELTAESDPGRLGRTAFAAPSGLPLADRTVSVTAEEDVIYTPQCFCGSLPKGRDGDRWMWAELKRPGAESAEFEIETPDAHSGRSADLTLWFVGFTELDQSPDHRLTVELNGVNVGTVLWDGKTAKQSVLKISAGLLTEKNRVTVTLEETEALFDGVWVDALQIDYTASAGTPPLSQQHQFRGKSSRSEYDVRLTSASAAVFDVTDPDSPILLENGMVNDGSLRFADPTGGTHFYQVVPDGAFKAPSAVRAPRQLLATGYGASYLILTNDSFVDRLDDLIKLRTAQGYRVAVENVNSIYDHFGHGEPNPLAIQAFLENAWESWSPPPQVVLIVGDGHFDPRQNLPDSQPVQVPPFLIDTDPWIGETAADNRYVTMDGPDDQLPDMAIGRLPINSVAELETIIEKFETYASAPNDNEWRGSFTLLSDNADSAGDFKGQTEDLIETFLAHPWRVAHYFLATAGEPGEQILANLKARWNDGHAMVMFTGHSSFNQWAVENLFHKDDIATLSPNGQLPLVLSMTCFTSSFHYPENDVLDERLIRDENGALATWGATGLGVSTGHDSLSSGFLESMFASDDKRLGSAAMAGKLQLALDQSPHLDLLDTFTLLGDPAMQMAFVEPEDDSGNPASNNSLYLPWLAR